MTRQVINFDAPERFVAGTVGMPGDRTFFLQARQDSAVTSVMIEKAQAAALAERVDQLLDEVITRGAADIPEGVSPGPPDTDPLSAPIVEEFRVGAMALGWDEANRRVVLEAHAASDEPLEIPDIGDDDADGSDTLRVWLTAAQARDFAERTRSVVAAGRPACPFCSQPLEADGHVCPRSNGYRRKT